MIVDRARIPLLAQEWPALSGRNYPATNDAEIVASTPAGNDDIRYWCQRQGHRRIARLRCLVGQDAEVFTRGQFPHTDPARRQFDGKNCTVIRCGDRIEMFKSLCCPGMMLL